MKCNGPRFDIAQNLYIGKDKWMHTKVKYNQKYINRSMNQMIQCQLYRELDDEYIYSL